MQTIHGKTFVVYFKTAKLQKFSPVNFPRLWYTAIIILQFHDTKGAIIIPFLVRCYHDNGIVAMTLLL